MPIQKGKLDCNSLGPGVNIHYESEYMAKRQQLISYYKSIRDDSDYESEDELFNELKERCKTLKRKSTIRYQMVTINFKTFSDHLVRLFEEKVLTKKCMSGWLIYTFQFGKDGDNPHVHIVVKKKIAKSHVIREIYNTLKVDYVENKECIDVKDKPDKYLPNGIDYCKRMKDQDDKMRKKYKLQLCYTSDKYMDPEDEEVEPYHVYDQTDFGSENS